jgi:molybdopterin-containing oxidoreductase family iron-sulfur binding subunit
MVYNRCVGTRYCANNCPYKVRRFNFLSFAKEEKAREPQRNPDVSVRPRGVMEKCTYCVQRIEHGRLEAEMEKRKIREGEVVTACQAACPASAISFGDLKNSESQVAKLKRDRGNYDLLAEEGARPRTSYLAKWQEHYD